MKVKKPNKNEVYGKIYENKYKNILKDKYINILLKNNQYHYIGKCEDVEIKVDNYFPEIIKALFSIKIYGHDYFGAMHFEIRYFDTEEEALIDSKNRVYPWKK